MSLSKYERYNLAAFIVGGLLLAFALIVFRLFATFRVPSNILIFQYSLGFAFLGVLLVSIIRAKTYSVKITYTVLIFAVSIGLLYPPSVVSSSDIVMSITYLLLAVGLGTIHYRFLNPSGTLYVLVITAFSHEFYLFSAAYCLLAFRSTGQPPYLIAIVLLTGIMYTFRNVLANELAKLQDDRAFARGLATFLSPLDRS